MTDDIVQIWEDEQGYLHRSNKPDDGSCWKVPGKFWRLYEEADDQLEQAIWHLKDNIIES